MNDVKTLKALKNKILSLAMQGKLIKQNEADEPASILLEKIKNEKAELLKQGKLKKEKPLSPINKEEVPYELPKSWQWVRLGEVCEIINGDRSSKYPSESDIKQFGIPFINAKNIINNKILLSTIKNFITIEKFQTLNSGKLLNNDIVFVLRGSVGKHGIFYTNNQYNTGFINAQLVILRPIFINEKYMNLMFDTRYFMELLDDKSTGSTVKQMSDNVLSKLVIPIPPLAEQERIVAKIEEIFAIIDEVEKNISENKKISKVLYNKILSLAMQGKLVKQNEADEPASVLLEKIKNEKAELLKQGKLKKEKPLPPINKEEVPYELPKSWQWVRLGEIGKTQTGTTPSISKDIYLGNYIPFVKPADIQNSKLIFSDYLSKEGLQYGRLIEKKSILMVCIGGSIGKCCYTDVDVSCNQQINTFSYHFKPFKFYFYCLKSEYFQTQIQMKSLGVATPIINKTLWENIPVPLPPLAEQERIVAKIEEIKEIIDDMG